MLYNTPYTDKVPPLYMHALQPPEYHDNREVMVPITSLSSRSSDLIVAKQMFSCLNIYCTQLSRVTISMYT